MSYILEALRRAEQRRQRDQSPAHLTPPPPAPAAQAARPVWRRGLAALALLLLGLALGVTRPWEAAAPAPIAAAPPPVTSLAAPPVAPPRPRALARPEPVASVTAEVAPAAPAAEPPPVRISLHAYAAQPGDRVVMINDRLLRQGEAVAPDLVLREITPDGVVLEYQGRLHRRGVR